MAGTTGDDGATTPGAAGGHDAQRSPAPPVDHAPAGEVPPPSWSGNPDQRYDAAAEQVTDATSAADHEEFRAAIDELRGDFVTGDKIVVTGHRGATVRAHRIPAETLAQPHVEASGLRHIEDALRHPGIVAVRGPEGSGRTAALLHVLTGGSTETVVLRLDPGTDLRTLAPEQFRNAQALILENLTEDHLDQLDDFEIDRLRGELESRQLGFTVSAALSLPTALTPMVVDIGEPPSASEVFARHFDAAQPSGDRRTRLLAATGVSERVGSALGPRTGLARAAELAMFLAAYEGPLEELADRLDAWLTLGSDAERLRWFQALPSVRAVSTAISLAVFNGLARETVAALADRLMEQIAPTPENQKREEVRNPYADTGVPAAMLRVTATREIVRFVEGDITLTVLRYKDPTYPGWVLRHIWDEFDAVRPALVTWLRELVYYRA